MRIICIHGFGGKSYDTDIAAAIRTTSQRLRGLAVETYSWNSGRVASGTIGADWLDAQENRKREAPKLAGYLEQWNEEIVVVAFSLGCWLLLDAIEANGATLPAPVSKVFFLGAAVPHNYPLRALRWPARFTANNYYSPRADWVLANAWRKAQGIPAAGEVGFADGEAGEAPVSNLRVHRAHKMLFNYKAIAAAVGEFICFQRGYRSPDPVNMEPEAKRTWGGHHMWDQIVRHRGLLVQRHSWVEHYRILEEATRKRIASASSLSALLPLVYPE